MGNNFYQQSTLSTNKEVALHLLTEPPFLGFPMDPIFREKIRLVDAFSKCIEPNKQVTVCPGVCSMLPSYPFDFSTIVITLYAQIYVCCLEKKNNDEMGT